jgi:hypothetical protein
MKYVILILAVLMIMNGVAYAIWYTDTIRAYEQYYDSTEALLDTLEKYDNWVDRFDPYEYYEAKEHLNHLK